jgi:hypothetical protein
LLDASSDARREGYRFIRIRAFDSPVVVRLEVQRDGSNDVVALVLSGPFGFSRFREMRTRTQATLSRRQVNRPGDRARHAHRWGAAHHRTRPGRQAGEGEGGRAARDGRTRRDPPEARKVSHPVFLHVEDVLLIHEEQLLRCGGSAADPRRRPTGVRGSDAAHDGRRRVRSRGSLRDGCSVRLATSRRTSRSSPAPRHLPLWAATFGFTVRRASGMGRCSCRRAGVRPTRTWARPARPLHVVSLFPGGASRRVVIKRGEVARTAASNAVAGSSDRLYVRWGRTCGPRIDGLQARDDP